MFYLIVSLQRLTGLVGSFQPPNMIPGQSLRIWLPMLLGQGQLLYIVPTYRHVLDHIRRLFHCLIATPLQILADLQTQMRASSHYLCPNITDSWLRRYQVLPGRTHPTMVTSGSGGFILHAIRMCVLLETFIRHQFIVQCCRYDDPSASSVMLHRRQKPKKTKTEREEHI